ncbi:hypothetical protein IEQ34_021420 [Dendrobium chrysotoxum]|uniref:Uncharacterized protein n=1 Tax=Dendrobium chrysotoxum TaxID=161865 RepID=A0AAV7G4Y2_DENCH|nr:hypothetical protein IEQ34_021420 [Dendrobium chrysotoxum]
MDTSLDVAFCEKMTCSQDGKAERQKNFEKRGSTRMRDMFTDIRKSGQRPLWIGEGVWAELSSAWGSLDYTRRRDQNRQNRASDVGGMGSSFHTGGSNTNICLLQKQVLGREPTPVELHSHTHKRQEDQQWVDERARRAYEEYTRLRESQAAAGEGSSVGSTDYSDYCTWSQAEGGMQHGRVYGLGSQAYAYEGQSSSGGSINVEITFQNEEGFFSATGFRRNMRQKYDMTTLSADNRVGNTI